MFSCKGLITNLTYLYILCRRIKSQHQNFYSFSSTKHLFAFQSMVSAECWWISFGLQQAKEKWMNDFGHIRNVWRWWSWLLLLLNFWVIQSIDLPGVILPQFGHNTKPISLIILFIYVENSIYNQIVLTM